jgi:hypothetical protein
MPVVKILIFLDLDKKSSFSFRHYFLKIAFAVLSFARIEDF